MEINFKKSYDTLTFSEPNSYLTESFSGFSLILPENEQVFLENFNESVSKPNSFDRSSVFSLDPCDIFVKLTKLEAKVQKINLKITENYSILRKKQEKTLKLTKMLEKLEENTLPTQDSLYESYPECSCSLKCNIF